MAVERTAQEFFEQVITQAPPTLKVEYHANNSGGRDWLTQGNWDALAAAGWDVRHNSFMPPPRLPMYANKLFHSIKEAVAEWERVTGQSASAMGCSCCGTPHSFSTEDIVTGESDYYSPSDSGYGSFNFD